MTTIYRPTTLPEVKWVKYTDYHNLHISLVKVTLDSLRTSEVPLDSKVLKQLEFKLKAMETWRDKQEK